jgi:hypothetical protein
MRIYYLKQANAQQVATTLTAIVQSITNAQQTQGASPFSPSMSIVADTRTNALIVTGVTRDFNEIGALIQHYDPGSQTTPPPAATPLVPASTPPKDAATPAEAPVPAAAPK